MLKPVSLERRLPKLAETFHAAARSMTGPSGLIGRYGSSCLKAWPRPPALRPAPRAEDSPREPRLRRTLPPPVGPATTSSQPATRPVSPSKRGFFACSNRRIHANGNTLRRQGYESRLTAKLFED